MSYVDFSTFMKVEVNKMKEFSMANEKEKRSIEDSRFFCLKENNEIIELLKNVAIKSNSIDPLEFHETILSKMGVFETPIDQDFRKPLLKRDMAEMMDADYEKEASKSEQKVQEAIVANVNTSTDWREARDDYECVLYARSVLIDEFRLNSITDDELSEIKTTGFMSKLLGTKKNENKKNVDYVLSLLSEVDGLKDLNIYEGIDKYREAVDNRFHELLEMKILYESMAKALSEAEKERSDAFSKLNANRRVISDLNDVCVVHSFFELAEESEEFDMSLLLKVYGFSDKTAKKYTENSMKIKVYNKTLDSLKKDEDLLFYMRKELSNKRQEIDNALFYSSSFEFVDFDEKKIIKELTKWSEYLQVRKSLRNNVLFNINKNNILIFENSLDAFCYLLFLDKDDCLNYKSTFFNKEEIDWLFNDMWSLNACNITVEYPEQKQDDFDSKTESVEILSLDLPTISVQKTYDKKSVQRKSRGNGGVKGNNSSSFSENISSSYSNNVTSDFSDVGVTSFD